MMKNYIDPMIMNRIRIWYGTIDKCFVYVSVDSIFRKHRQHVYVGNNLSKSELAIWEKKFLTKAKKLRAKAREKKVKKT